MTNIQSPDLTLGFFKNFAKFVRIGTKVPTVIAGGPVKPPIHQEGRNGNITENSGEKCNRYKTVIDELRVSRSILSSLIFSDLWCSRVLAHSLEYPSKAVLCVLTCSMNCRRRTRNLSLRGPLTVQLTRWVASCIVTSLIYLLLWCNKS